MSHQYRREDELVLSEFDWIGRYPTEWLRTRLGYHIEFITGFAFKSEGFSFDSGVKLVRGDNVTEGHLRWGEKTRFWSEITCDISKYTLQAGDVLIGMDGSKVGKNYACVKEADLPLLLVQRVARLRSTGAMRETFLTYLIGSRLFKIWTTLVKTDPAIPHISPDDINGFPVVLPSYDEQKQIAAFLDYETAKIDALIEKQQQLIALLGEKRQAVISHAVTKGLNPDAPMRDSGIEWLGEVPEHWTFKKLRYFAQILRGKFTHRPRNDPAFYDGEFPFVQTGDITSAGKFITQYHQTLNARGTSVSKRFPKGTLVMAIAANIGDVAILDFPAYFPDSIVGLVPNKTADVMFMYYMMQAMKQPMLRRATISTQMNLNVDQIAWLTAACPPLEEQQAIAAMLDEQLKRMDELHSIMSEKIDLLQERRTALISAAVTGKIDVRGWKPPSSARIPETEMEVA